MRCQGCGRPLYILATETNPPYRCVLCGKPHSPFYAVGRSAMTVRGLKRMAKSEGWSLDLPRGRSAFDAPGPPTSAPSSTVAQGRAAEEEVREWMSGNGWRDARLTASGADGGVDVRARGLVAQVKDTRAKVGRPAIQQLYGIARAESATPLFFARGGFTAQGATWADEHGVARFTIGPVAPCNDHAERLVREVRRAGSRAKRAEARSKFAAQAAEAFGRASDAARQAREAREEQRRGTSF